MKQLEYYLKSANSYIVDALYYYIKKNSYQITILQTVQRYISTTYNFAHGWSNNMRVWAKKYAKP